jgi:hypothetical protein
MVLMLLFGFVESLVAIYSWKNTINNELASSAIYEFIYYFETVKY